MPRNEVSIIIKAKNFATAQLQKVGRGLKAVGKAGLSIGRGIAKGAAVAAAALVALAAVTKKLIDLNQVQQQAEAKRNAVLRSTGFAAGFTASELNKMAAEMQKTVGIADEVVISTQAIIAGFTNIKGDVFKRSQSAIIDFATVMKKAGASTADVETRSITLAKAINDPVGQLTLLTRLGIAFTDQQREQIRILTESGDVMSAQNVVLTELETRYGGAAKASHEADSGFTDVSNTLGDIGEQFGAAIQDSTGLKDSFSDLNERLVEFANSGIIELWAENIKNAIESIAPAFNKVLGFLGAVKDKIQTAAAFAGGLTVGDSLQERFENAKRAADEIPAQIAREREARLAAIRERKAAEQQATEDRERAEMESIQRVQQAESDAVKMSAAERKAVDQQIHNEKLALLNGEIAAAQQAFAAANQALGVGFDDFIRKQEEGEAAAGALADRQDRADKLRAKQGRGTKLSREDQAFLDKFDAFNLEQANALKMRNAADLRRVAAEQARDALMKEQNKLTKEQRDLLKDIKVDLASLLRAPGG